MNLDAFVDGDKTKHLIRNWVAAFGHFVSSFFFLFAEYQLIVF